MDSKSKKVSKISSAQDRRKRCRTTIPDFVFVRSVFCGRIDRGTTFVEKILKNRRNRIAALQDASPEKLEFWFSLSAPQAEGTWH
jgi:hypothetical protein